MTEAELALSDPRLETAPDLSVLGSTSPPSGARAGRNMRGSAALPGEGENFQTTDLGSGLGGVAVRDALRGYVNIQRGTPGSANLPEARRGAHGETPGLAGFDIGPAANEWVQETVQSILSSALNLDINERGLTSFSVFGLGDFSVNVSGDRSEIALATGDTVLLTAQRPQDPGSPGAGGGYPGAEWSAGGFRGSSNGGVNSPLGDSPFRQAMELLLELAGHPLSFLVYALIAVYGLVWTVLSRRNAAAMARYRSPATQSRSYPGIASTMDLRSPPAGTGKRKRRHRTRPSTHRA